MTTHRRRRGSLTILTAVSLVMMFACGADDTEPETTTPDTSTGIANPASIFCVERGGTLEIVDESGGEVGYCNLPDGTRIEEWEYYRSQTGGSVTEP